MRPSGGLLGRHEEHGSHDYGRRGHAWSIEQAREPKVEKLELLRGREKYVLRLEVAVDDAHVVGSSEHIENLDRVSDGRGRRENPACLLPPRLQGHTVKQVHDEERGAGFVGPVVEDARDATMLDPVGCAPFSQEAIPYVRLLGVFGMQNLDREAALIVQVSSGEYGPRPADSEERIKPIFVVDHSADASLRTKSTEFAFVHRRIVPAPSGGGKMKLLGLSCPDCLVEERGVGGLTGGVTLSYHRRLMGGIDQRPEGRVGTIVGKKYRLDALLGVGGMAAVYSATHTKNAARFAIKMLHSRHSTERMRTRFRREGFVANSVKHEAAVRIVDDALADDDTPFLVMDLLEGTTVHALWETRGHRFPATAVLSLTDALLAVLEVAHEKKIVHRDLKPGNLFLLPDGALRLLDFGIAHFHDGDGDEPHTTAGTMFGTPAFMPPEQVLPRREDGDIDGRADIFATGATMFTLLSGAFVHDGQNGRELVVKAATQQARSLASVLPTAPRSLVDIVDRALKFERDDRWSCAAEMREAVVSCFRELAEGQEISKAPVLAVIRGHAPPRSGERTSVGGRAARPPRRDLTPIRKQLGDQLNDVLYRAPDKAQFTYLLSFIRCVLQYAAISAIEYWYATKPDRAESPASIQQLLKPVDETPVAILDDLVPLLRSDGWKKCAPQWLPDPSSGVPARAAALRELVQTWLQYRGKGETEADVQQRNLERDLPWLKTLANMLLAGLGELLPCADAAGSLSIDAPRPLALTGPRMIDGKPVVIRNFTRHGAAWRVRYNALSERATADGSYLLDDSCALISACCELRNAYIPYSLTLASGEQWRPTVLLPQRQTPVFAGRAEELSALREWYETTESNACLIYGNGGIGKTTLVLEFLNGLLERPDVVWLPAVICFYSAKQWRWSVNNRIEEVRQLAPAVVDAVRELTRLLDDVWTAAWQTMTAADAIKHAVTLYQGVGLKRHQILLILDNTETLARTQGDEHELMRVVSAMSTKLCRVLMTSRRREHIEAFPIQLAPFDKKTATSLVRKLAETYNATPIIQAGEARIARAVEELECHPLLLDAFVRYASYGGRSVEDARQQVLTDTRDGLADFLFVDAWRRIDVKSQTVFLVLGRIADTFDDEVAGWACSEVGIAHLKWRDVAFEETKFGSLVNYGSRCDIQLSLGAREYFAERFKKLTTEQRDEVERIAERVRKRYRKLLEAQRLPLSERAQEAFRTAAARAARLAAQAGNREEAILWYEDAVSFDKTNAGLWEHFTWYLIRGENLDRAARTAAEWCRQAPLDPDAYFAAGVIAARRGDIAASDRALERALSFGKAANLCDLERARVRIEGYFGNRPRQRGLLNEARKFLKLAEAIPGGVPPDRRDRHLENCRSLRRRLTSPD
jgi:serine/threonine protein kinase/Tfp pilus assembly protein PilF